MSLYRRFRLWLHDLSEKEAAFIASKEWLETYEWRQCRYQVLEKIDGRCECCGRNRHQLPNGVYLNVDHIKPRRTHPWLATNIRNLQVLDGECNHGKGNTTRDWRKKNRPHREDK
jgi:5-methylcytosine-specific restriction enzyme A